jgi:hypothetical protein
VVLFYGNFCRRTVNNYYVDIIDIVVVLTQLALLTYKKADCYTNNSFIIIKKLTMMI